MCVVLLQTLTSDWHKCTVYIPPVLPLSFLHTPALNILLWKNPFRRYRPLPLHKLKISTQDHLYNPPLADFSFCPLDCCPSLLFTPLRSVPVQFIISHNSKLWYDSSLSVPPPPPTPSPPSASSHLFPVSLLSFWQAPSKPSRLLGISADIESVPSLHQGSQSDIQPTCWPPSWPDEEWSRHWGLAGGETLWTDEFSGHTNTEETEVDFLEVNSWHERERANQGERQKQTKKIAKISPQRLLSFTFIS